MPIDDQVFVASIGCCAHSDHHGRVRILDGLGESGTAIAVMFIREDNEVIPL